MFTGFLISFILISSTSAVPNATIGPAVQLDYGTFHGLDNPSTGIIYYRGVRFADPPVGNLRWRAPVSPPSTHLGDVDATEFADACIDAGQAAVSPGTSEDCLFGNVYVPINTTASDALPVMVWFHGGGFQTGNSRAPPERIMQSSANPMIFVSFAYRLGPLGFLGGNQVHEDGDLNAGFLDQRAALRWLQRYISRFGGDKEKVTIWGESAGAGSTMFHLIANGGNNENLFRAAMGDSPSLSFVPSFDEDYDVTVFDDYASFAGCGSRQGNGVMNCLRRAEIDTLAMASSRLLASRTSTLFVFAPILDGSVINERPVEAFKAGHFAHVPVLYGSNTNEGARWSAGLRDPSANTSMSNATEDTVFNFIRGQYPTLTQASIDQGFELYPLDSFNDSFSLQGQQMYGETRYICTASLIPRSASRFNTSYQFHYDNPHLGSFHADDLRAFFGSLSFADENDLALFDAMREYFTSFVTTGIPSAKNEISWEPVSSPAGNSRILFHPGNVAMEAISEELDTRCNFWHGISGELEI